MATTESHPADIEMAAMQSLCSLVTPEEQAELGLYCRVHGRTLVLACTAEKGILFNRTIGFDAQDANHIEEILEVYRQRNAARAFVSVHEGDQESVTRLSRLSLPEARPWRKFLRKPLPAGERPTDLNVRTARPEDGQAFGRIVCDAFDLPRGMIPVLARLPEHPDWTVFMSFDGNGTAAGGGALFTHRDAAWLGFGATAPAFRMRGSQGAIMAARVEDARQRGARIMSTETGEAVPGDPQHSWNNIIKAGFQPHHRILNFAFTAS